VNSVADASAEGEDADLLVVLLQTQQSVARAVEQMRGRTACSEEALERICSGEHNYQLRHTSLLLLDGALSLGSSILALQPHRSGCTCSAQREISNR
jgi:hypothetical protein